MSGVDLMSGVLKSDNPHWYTDSRVVVLHLSSSLTVRTGFQKFSYTRRRDT